MVRRMRRVRHARDVAKALGAGATSPGEAGSLACHLPGWAVWAVTRGTVPDWPFDALERAAGATGAGERAAVVVSAVRQGVRLRRLVLLTFEDFQTLTSVDAPDAGALPG